MIVVGSLRKLKKSRRLSALFAGTLCLFLGQTFGVPRHGETCEHFDIAGRITRRRSYAAFFGGARKLRPFFEKLITGALLVRYADINVIFGRGTDGSCLVTAGCFNV